MGRRAARALHLGLFLLGVLLYIVFVLPRWWVLTGQLPSSLATAGRIAAGIPIAAAALPVLTILRQALGRKVKTPELVLRLRAWSAVLHVVAGALILLAAIAEIWLGLGAAGPYLFAVYGAAGAIAILGALALYLSFVAEKPPAEPKPVKPVKVKPPKAAKQPRGKKRGATETVPETATEKAATAVTVDETDVDEETVTDTVDDHLTDDTVDDTAKDTAADTAVTESADDAAGDQPVQAGLANKRPTGKRRNRLRR
ncbi:hypothetical protein [Mycolicibacterium sp.]|uniref:hypothetical protein n=1 Tax=Mycolicibacterium sp. TaxID=2320850 RepID=UPI0028B186BD|nr:hypothetical protein [Mycolicibacterium sp.]